MKKWGSILCIISVSLLLAGFENPTNLSKDSSSPALLKKSNPAAELRGKEVRMSGVVMVEQVDQKRVSEEFSFFSSNRNQPIKLKEGSRRITLEGSFNREGKIYVYEGDLVINVEPGCNYFPVAGLELNLGKAWMWIQDSDRKVRVSDLVEARFVKVFSPEEEDYLDIWSYESIIDPDVMADRKAACDITQVPGYMADESLDRGDLSAYRRQD